MAVKIKLHGKVSRSAYSQWTCQSLFVITGGRQTVSQAEALIKILPYIYEFKQSAGQTQMDRREQP